MPNVVLAALLVAWLPTTALSQERLVPDTVAGSSPAATPTWVASEPGPLPATREEAPPEERPFQAEAAVAPTEPASAVQPTSDAGRFLYNVALGVAITVISTLLLRAIL
jgi:hypothetical protein